MKFFLAIIIIFVLGLSLFLAVSVCVAFGLVWIFPTISFEIGVLIGAVSLGMMCYLFSKIPPDMDSPSEDDNDIFEDNNDSFEDDIDIFHKVYDEYNRSHVYFQNQHEVKEKDVNLPFSFLRSSITALNSVKLFFTSTP